MGITEILQLLGGLALFLYGMQMMSTGLETAAGNKMKTILERLTSNRIKGVLAGAIITAVIQSSSATTVMVVGFVNSGLMTLRQAVWVIMGANIGTTITGQLIALDVGALAPFFAFVGVACIMFVKKENVRHISEVIAGFGVLFIGMDMMGNAMVPLQSSEVFINFMTTFSNPLAGIAMGAVFTAIIQSSSASVGILQALASAGLVPLSSAVYILFGQNIGTCITAVLASIGTKPAAKRTTIIHLMFNIIGSVLFTIICILTPFTDFMAGTAPGNAAAQIANVHTTFNVVTTLLLLPFGTYMASLAEKILPESESEKDGIKRLKYITPFETSYQVGQAAIMQAQVEQEVGRMTGMVRRNIEDSFESLIRNDVSKNEEITEREDYIDYLNVEISRYIVHVMSSESASRDLKNISGYYTVVGNLERIGDHAMNLAGYAVNLKKWGQQFSEDALAELKMMRDVCLKTVDEIEDFTKGQKEKILERTARNEQKIDDMRDDYRNRQVARMEKGTCQADTGIIYSEILTDFERIGDHALNIAQQYNSIA
ncbi:Na/Pi cotransporter family protein [Mordavella massiliensis]|uniref:Na/Pi cotransporter family protein n=1 Tax=Mordavella massiliensis TaxID=1871024 RepID=A0A939BGH6_9CLOT|nr:Na/Pi cotransporter family protein [Mordavella massiliensis]MBM6949402.1 Na/Pi cotransporter family protein [Mordavella massiliensis]